MDRHHAGDERAGSGVPVGGGARAAARRKQIEFATLPEASYPNLVECAIPMTACDDPESHYALGVDLFLAGVEALSKR